MGLFQGSELAFHMDHPIYHSAPHRPVISVMAMDPSYNNNNMEVWVGKGLFLQIQEKVDLYPQLWSVNFVGFQTFPAPKLCNR